MTDSAIGWGVGADGEGVAAPGERGNGWTFTGKLLSFCTVEISRDYLE